MNAGSTQHEESVYGKLNISIVKPKMAAFCVVFQTILNNEYMFHFVLLQFTINFKLSI